MNHQNLFAGAQRQSSVRLAALLLVVGALSGCSSLKGKFENRLAVSADGQAVFMLSLYGPVGISARISDSDARAVAAALAASSPK